jgi:hypothetical protein
MVYTNLSFEQICALAVFAQNFDDLDDINRHVLKGEYHWAYDVYYYLLDQEAKADLVKEIFGIDIGKDTKHDINYVLAQEAARPDKEETPEEEPTDEPLPTERPTPKAGTTSTEEPTQTGGEESPSTGTPSVETEAPPATP